MTTPESVTKPDAKKARRTRLASYRKDARRIDFYIAPRILPYLEYFLALQPGSSVSATLNGIIEFAYKEYSGNGKAMK